MKYDFSFLNPQFETVITHIETSIKLLEHNYEQAVYTARKCCQVFISVIGKVEGIKLENNLSEDINILKFNKT